jgi:hypothetical protein
LGVFFAGTPRLSKRFVLVLRRSVAGKHKQAEAEDAAEEAAESAAEDGEPEPEPESDAVEQLAVALFDFPPEEEDDLGYVCFIQQDWFSVS